MFLPKCIRFGRGKNTGSAYPLRFPPLSAPAGVAGFFMGGPRRPFAQPTPTLLVGTHASALKPGCCSAAPFTPLKEQSVA